MSLPVLNSLQEDILNMFSSICDSENFYFTGGSALAHFYLKHRKSNDLDFFTSTEELIVPFSFALQKTLDEKSVKLERKRAFKSFVEIEAERRGEYTLIHICCDSPYRLGDIKKFSQYPNLNVDNLDDIAANKILALFSRATFRDFVDIYFLVKKKYFNENDLIEKAQKKDPGFDVYWLGVALGRMENFSKDIEDLHLLIETCDLEEMRSFFRDWQRQIRDNLKG